PNRLRCSACIFLQSELTPWPARQDRVEAIAFRGEKSVDRSFAALGCCDQLREIVAGFELLVVADLGLFAGTPLLGVRPGMRGIDRLTVHLHPVAHFEQAFFHDWRNHAVSSGAN